MAKSEIKRGHLYSDLFIRIEFQQEKGKKRVTKTC
jgi:hypothetical protein